MADNLTEQQRSFNMSRNRGRDTGPELAFRRSLVAAGLRGYRVNVKAVPGSPDVAWIGLRVAIFIDGAFWHGHPEALRRQRSEYWKTKLRRNRERDRNVNATLQALGWQVIRLWDYEVIADVDACVEKVECALLRARATAA